MNRIVVGSKVKIHFSNLNRPLYRWIKNIKDFEELVFVVRCCDRFCVSFLDLNGKQWWIDINDVELSDEDLTYPMPEMKFKKKCLKGRIVRN